MSNDASPPPSAQLDARARPRPAVHAGEASDADPEPDPDAVHAGRRRRRHVTVAAETGFHDDHQGRPAPSPSPARWPRGGRERRRRRSTRKRRNPGLIKKLAFVTHLLKTLDLVVFAELSALYYMECSLFRFALRIFGQSIYLTPKDETFPLLMPASRIHILVIVVPNIICMLLHIFAALPRGPDFHRGYQHGGLVIDFVGQKPPTSRLYYLLADLVILAVQCLMLAIHTDRESLRATLKTPKSTLPNVAAADTVQPRSAEDLDAEERGVSRHAPGMVVEEADGIEMLSLDRGPGNGGGGEPAEGRRRGRGSGRHNSTAWDDTGDESSRTFLSDLMSSGNAIIGEYHVLGTLRTAATDFERTASYSLQTVGYRATLAAMQARRRGASLQNQPASQGG